MPQPRSSRLLAAIIRAAGLSAFHRGGDGNHAYHVFAFANSALSLLKQQSRRRYTANGFAFVPIRADGEVRHVWAVGRYLHGPTEAYWEELEGSIGPASRPQFSYPQCPFSTSGSVIPSLTLMCCHDKGTTMKALALLTAAALTLLSVAASAQTYGGPFYCKGKAPPPPPVATKG